MARLMELVRFRNVNSRSRRTSPSGLAVAVLAAVAGLLSATGCEELDARRTLQEASRAHSNGRFEEASKHCEKALDLMPNFDVALHNCGLIYHKRFRPGVETDDNLAMANRATELFQKYLELNPADNQVVKLMSKVWIDAGQYNQALQYWERELAKDSGNIEIMEILAGITRQAGDWEKSVEWYRRIVATETSPDGKANGLKNIAKLCSGKLFNRTGVAWEDRLRYADIGIAALQEAKALTPDDPEIERYQGSIYGLRAEAHQAVWAQLIDSAEGRFHHITASRMIKAQEAAAAGTDPMAPAPADTGKDGKPEPDSAKDGAGADGADGEAAPAQDGAKDSAGAAGAVDKAGDTGTDKAGDTGADKAGDTGTDTDKADEAAPAAGESKTGHNSAGQPKSDTPAGSNDHKSSDTSEASRSSALATLRA
ncbi:MAG: tetratricopeptide repeat protein [Myxococcota bacterium]